MSEETRPLAVFGYAFGHRKTQDFLVELAAAGERKVHLLAAPWQQLAHNDPNVYFPDTLDNASPRHPREICAALGFGYHEIAHDDVAAISGLQATAGFSQALIAGARILKRRVIDLFPEGVLNFHPGKLPETAGLDAFFYSIRKGVPLGVTAHFIDHRIDAGEQLFFEETVIGPEDTPEIALYNNYQTQIRALRNFLEKKPGGLLDRAPIDRPARNMPMTPEDKRAVVRAFPAWRSARALAAMGAHVVEACQAGDEGAVLRALGHLPELLHYRTPEGWTPLIVAAFHGHAGLVRSLLQLGADPNATGRKGTTVLMYAKSPMLGKDSADYAILDCLLEHGADLSRRDMHGRDIFHYVDAAGDLRLLGWLRAKGGRA